MFYYKKALLFSLLFFSLYTAGAADINSLRDTLIKIKITPTAEINPQARSIEMRLKNSVLNTRYPGNITKQVALGEALYKEFADLIGELTGPDFKEKTETGFMTSVLDGSNYIFEIVTPAGTRRVNAYEPDADHYPLLRKLLDLTDRLYQGKNQN